MPNNHGDSLKPPKVKGSEPEPRKKPSPLKHLENVRDTEFRGRFVKDELTRRWKESPIRINVLPSLGDDGKKYTVEFAELDGWNCLQHKSGVKYRKEHKALAWTTFQSTGATLEIAYLELILKVNKAAVSHHAWHIEKREAEIGDWENCLHLLANYRSGERRGDKQKVFIKDIGWDCKSHKVTDLREFQGEGASLSEACEDLYKKLLEADKKHHKLHKEEAEREVRTATSELEELRKELEEARAESKKNDKGGSGNPSGGQGNRGKVPEVKITGPQ